MILDIKNKLRQNDCEEFSGSKSDGSDDQKQDMKIKGDSIQPNTSKLEVRVIKNIDNKNNSNDP